MSKAKARSKKKATTRRLRISPALADARAEIFALRRAASDRESEISRLSRECRTNAQRAESLQAALLAAERAFIDRDKGWDRAGRLEAICYGMIRSVMNGVDPKMAAQNALDAIANRTIGDSSRLITEAV